MAHSLVGLPDDPYTRRMEVQLIRLADDEHYDEGWERVTDESDLYGIDAAKLAGEPWWQVSVAAAEFVRGEPFAGEFRQRIAAALSGIAGVQSVDEEDREVWLVTGHPPSAEALIQVVAGVLDELASRIRPHIYDLE